MSDIRIRDLVEGRPLEGVYLLQSRSEGTTRTGKPFLTLVLSDATGTLPAKAWSGDLVGEEAVGQAIRVQGRTDSYQGRLQAVLERVEIVPAGSYPMEQLVPASRFPPEELDRRLDALLDCFTNPFLRALLDGLLAEPGVRAAFRRGPAGRSMHHAYLGGLLEHALSMAGAFEGLAPHYEALYPGLLDRDLVRTGILLHDLGKIDEISADPGFAYTDRGRLLGHIYMGSARVARVAATIEGFPPALLDRVLHLILAHHGELEYGSPVRPRSAEAVVLHYLDQIDAKLNHAWARVDESDEGATWTGFSRMFDGSLLIPPGPTGAGPARLGATPDEVPAAAGASPPAEAPAARSERARHARKPDEDSLTLFPDD